MLTRAIDVLKGLLVLKAGKAVVRSKKLELLHGQEVVVNSECTLLKDRCKLMLARSNLIVLGFLQGCPASRARHQALS